MNERTPATRRIETRAGALALWTWPGETAGPTALFLHATGFHGRVWDATIRALPPGWRALALDLPGHGASDPHPPLTDWGAFVDPIVDVADALDLAGALIVGHSMGGYLAARLALERPAAVGGLVLVDPVMPPPEAYVPGPFRDLPGPEAHPVARRRDRWPGWEAFFERFRDREPYSLWRPEILEAYCRHGLRPAPDGDGYVLACAPTLEASVYFNSWRSNILDRLKAIAAPATILRARYVPRDPNLPVDFSRSTTWSGLADHFRDAIDVDMAPLTHFIPMQDPEAVARHVAALAERADASTAIVGEAK